MIGKFLPRANDKFSTTLSAEANIGDTTLSLSAPLANYPTYIVLEPGTSNEEERYVSSQTGSVVTIDALTKQHLLGANVQNLNNKEFHNTIAGLYEVDHNSDGTHQISNFGLKDYIVSGLSISVTTSTLIATIGTGAAFIAGKYYSSLPGDGGHTYTASKDTYVDLDNTGAYHYLPVANGATAPSLTANAIRIAKVVSNATAIVVANQGLRQDNIFVYPTTPFYGIDGYQLLEDAIAKTNIGTIGLADYVKSGFGFTSQSGLSVTIALGIAFIGGKQYSIASDGGHTYAINTDTYIDVDKMGNYTYASVSNNAAAPSLTANTIRVGKVVTNGTVIASTVQSGVCSNGVLIYPSSPIQGIVASQLSQSAGILPTQLATQTYTLLDNVQVTGTSTGYSAASSTSTTVYSGSFTSHGGVLKLFVNQSGLATTSQIVRLYAKIDSGTPIEIGHTNGSNITLGAVLTFTGIPAGAHTLTYYISQDAGGGTGSIGAFTTGSITLTETMA